MTAKCIKNGSLSIYQINKYIGVSKTPSISNCTIVKKKSLNAKTLSIAFVQKT